MSKFILSFAFAALLLLVFAPAQAQFNPQGSTTFMFTAGIGASGWGIPIFGRIEVPVAESITVGGGASFQTNNQRFLNDRWNHSIIGFHGRGSYHFNTVLNIPDEFDFYAGASLGYYVLNTTYKGSTPGAVYTGGRNGGANIGIHVGGRYFFGSNNKTALNLEAGGGNLLSAGTIGITFLL